MDWKQIISGTVIGVILGIGGTLLIQERRIAILETKIENLKSQITQPSLGTQQQDVKTLSQPELKAKPEELIAIIQEQQRKNVKESWGESTYQCFTDNDLSRFVQNRIAESVVNSLRRDPKFLDVILSIRKMEPGKRLDLLISADKPLRRTWAELGRISREGQTVAGQEAEKMIAKEIVNLVKKLVSLPEAEFLALYQ